MAFSRTLLWVVGLLIVALAVAKSAIPGAWDNRAVMHAQLFLFGSFMSIAVWRTIVGYGLEVRPTGQKRDDGTPKYLPPGQVYKSHKIASMILGVFIIAPFLAVAAYHGRFSEFGGWLVAPIMGIGPALFLRDYLSRR